MPAKDGNQSDEFVIRQKEVQVFFDNHGVSCDAWLLSKGLLVKISNIVREIEAKPLLTAESNLPVVQQYGFNVKVSLFILRDLLERLSVCCATVEQDESVNALSGAILAQKKRLVAFHSTAKLSQIADVFLVIRKAFIAVVESNENDFRVFYSDFCALKQLLGISNVNASRPVDEAISSPSGAISVSDSAPLIKRAISQLFSPKEAAAAKEPPSPQSGRTHSFR